MAVSLVQCNNCEWRGDKSYLVNGCCPMCMSSDVSQSDYSRLGVFLLLFFSPLSALFFMGVFVVAYIFSKVLDKITENERNSLNNKKSKDDK